MRWPIGDVAAGSTQHARSALAQVCRFGQCALNLAHDRYLIAGLGAQALQRIHP